jgi:hypothetical protein
MSIYAGSLLDFTWERFVTGIGRGGEFLGAHVPARLQRWRC